MQKALSKLIQKIILLALFILIGTVIVTASAQESNQNTPSTKDIEFEQAYNAYLATYDQYRATFTEFLRARNNYLTYKTLISQTEVIDKAKVFLIARDDVIITYIDLLFSRNINPELQAILTQEKVFFRAHKEKIPAAATLSDVQGFSNEVKNHYGSLESIAKQVSGAILLSRVENIDGQLNNFEENLTQFVLNLEKERYDTATLQRWLIESRNKLLLAQQNLRQAKVEFAQVYANPNQYHTARNTLFSANQYYKESTIFFNELLTEIKYGNY